MFEDGLENLTSFHYREALTNAATGAGSERIPGAAGNTILPTGVEP